jgi:hypothetical protein
MAKFLTGLFVACFACILFSCSKEYSYELNTNAIAQGTLWDSNGACLPDTIYGTFYNGVPPGPDTAYVSVQVNVTGTGSYNITSDFQNGLQFADSGYFGTTGITTVKLKPIGVAIIPITSTFTIHFDSTFCSFAITIKDSTGTGLGGQDTTGIDSLAGPGLWKFSTDSGGIFNGAIGNAHVYPDTLANGSTNGYIFNILGFTSTGDSVMLINILMPTSTITTGSYTTLDYNSDSSRTTTFAFCPISGNNCFYYAEGVSNDPSVKVTININSYDSATGVVTGTFSGTAFDGGPPGTMKIINGSFNATVQ